MAAPRCTRALLGPARNANLVHGIRAHPQTFSRSKGSRAEEDDDSGMRGRKTTRVVGQPRRRNESDITPFDHELTDMGIDAEKFKTLWRSQQDAAERRAEWEPKTREEAQKLWKSMQDTPDHLTLLDMYKSVGVQPIKLAKERGITLPTDKPPLPSETQAALDQLRTPINVQAIHLRPLRRSPEYGLPVCDLQLRTYSIRNLLLFADFAVRAAYYMGLPARGPIPLPRITERWTVPKSNFIFKKSQENFERITMRRMIQIQDGHPDTVKAWLAFLLKHQFHGVGMKANIWEYESLETATRAGYEIKEGDYSRRREGAVLQKVEEILGRKNFQEAMKSEGTKVELRP